MYIYFKLSDDTYTTSLNDTTSGAFAIQAIEATNVVCWLDQISVCYGAYTFFCNI